MLRVRLDISYDGTGFHGWATQPGLRTVQETLETALKTILRYPVRLTVAGRTDAGVHAAGQVAHFDIPEDIWNAIPERDTRGPEQVLLTRLAGFLGVPGIRANSDSDLVVRQSILVPPEFDARFSAIYRRYLYRICDQLAVCDPLRRRDTLWVRTYRKQLDISNMNEAAQLLLGEHDFIAFCKPRPGATTVRTLKTFTWQRQADGLVVAEVVADAFCRSMVRSLVGASLAVGRGTWPISKPAKILQEARRDHKVTTAPPHGLSLVEVGYPPEDLFGERAQVSRQTRGLCCE